MLLGTLGDALSLEYLFNQIYSTPWPIQFITQELIGRAGRVTKPAMNAGTQNGVGFATRIGIFYKIG